MVAAKQDSNRTGLAIAEEASLKVLPASPVWYEQEPNEYSDFGSDLSLVARNPINASRQNQKGGIVDLDASGGFSTDFTQSNMQRILQGFVFADAREKQKSDFLSQTSNPVASIASGVLSFTNNFATAIPVGALVLNKNFATAANNGLKVATAATLKSYTAAGLVNDAAPVGASAAVVGFQFPSADAALTLANGVLSLTATATDLTTLGLTPGEWVYVGGDTVGSQLTGNIGYARIKSIVAGAIVFDKISWANPSATNGSGKTVQLFFGTVLRNEKNPDLIKRRSYQIERQLGKDDDGMQSEYLTGAVANELTINIPQADKLNADLTFVALDNEQRTGSQGLKAGVRVNRKGEGLVNTSSNVVRMKMSIVDSSLNPTAMFAYLTDATLAITNNVSPNKAIGVLGAFDTSAGNFEVSGDITAYFNDVRAVRAIRQNADVTLDYIFAANNAGFVFDIPLLALGGGRLNVSAGEPIELPLETSAAENPQGYTLLFTFFDYLPSVAMAS